MIWRLDIACRWIEFSEGQLGITSTSSARFIKMTLDLLKISSRYLDLSLCTVIVGYWLQKWIIYAFFDFY